MRSLKRAVGVSCVRLFRMGRMQCRRERAQDGMPGVAGVGGEFTGRLFGPVDGVRRSSEGLSVSAGG